MGQWLGHSTRVWETQGHVSVRPHSSRVTLGTLLRVGHHLKRCVGTDAAAPLECLKEDAPTPTGELLPWAWLLPLHTALPTGGGGEVGLTMWLRGGGQYFSFSRTVFIKLQPAL